MVIAKNEENKRCGRDLRERADSYPNFKTEFGSSRRGIQLSEKTQKCSHYTLVERLLKILLSHRKPMDGKQ